MQNLALALPVAAAVLASPSLAAPWAQAPAPSVRHDLNGDDLPSTNYASKRTPALAAGGAGFLAVWSDRRAASYQPEFIVGDDSDFDLYAQRLAADGSPLDTTAFRLGATSDRDFYPEVAWSGTEWAVVWLRQPISASNFGVEVLGVRVRPNGTLVDPAPVSLFEDQSIQNFALTAHAGGFTVAAEVNNSIVARLWGHGGLGAEVPLLAPSNGQGFDLAYGHGVHVLTWSASNGVDFDIVAQRFDGVLVPLDPAPWSVGATQVSDRQPLIAAGATGFLVTWLAFDSWAFNMAILAARVTAGGQTIDQVPLAVSSAWTPGPGPGSITYSGGAWAIGFDRDAAHVARVSESGVVLDFNGFPLGTPPSEASGVPGLAPAATGGPVAVWVRPRSNGDTDLIASIVVPPTTSGVQHTLAGGARTQLTPDLAAHGPEQALVHLSKGGGVDRVLLSRLAPSGEPLPGPPIEVATGTGFEAAYLATDGGRYLVLHTIRPSAFSLTRELWMRRVAFDGTLLDPAPVLLGSGRVVACTGANGEFTVASADGQVIGGGNRWWRVRGSDGAVVTGPTSFESNFVNDIALAAGPSGTTLAWFSWFQQPGCFLRTIDNQGLMSPPVQVSVSGSLPLSVATSGNESLVVWTELGSVATAVFGRRFDLSGVPLDPMPFEIHRSSAPFHPRRSPEVTWDGSQYVCVFQSPQLLTPLEDTRSDIRAARILANGTVLDPDGFLVEGSIESEVQPTIVGLGGGRSLIASMAFRAEAPLWSHRIAVRSLDGTCPPPSNYCTAKLTSLGTLPSVSSTGSTSVVANDLRLTLTQCVPNSFATLVSAAQAGSSPLFNATLCLTPPLQRGGIVALDGTGAGSIVFPLHPVMLGEERHFQWIARDAAQPDGTGAALSDGLRIRICP